MQGMAEVSSTVKASEGSSNEAGASCTPCVASKNDLQCACVALMTKHMDLGAHIACAPGCHTMLTLSNTCCRVFLQLT